MNVFRKNLVVGILGLLCSQSVFSQITISYNRNGGSEGCGFYLTSSPSGADIYIDNDYMGKTPLKISEYKTSNGWLWIGTTGNYTKLNFVFLLVAKKEGYEDFAEPIKIIHNDNLGYWGNLKINLVKEQDENVNLNQNANANANSVNINNYNINTVGENGGGNGNVDNVLRWKIQSDPNGARIFWRIISSTQEVKSTNENFLASTPYEETRSFNIPGLTYENSSHVTMELKVTKRGYVEQVKRFNLRMALDQQEINSFFELYAE